MFLWPHDSQPSGSNTNTCTSNIHTVQRRGRHPDSCHCCSLLLSLGHSSLMLHTVWVSPPLARRSKAKAFDGEFQKVPLVLLASVLTGRWQSNDNYSPIRCPWNWHQRPIALLVQEEKRNSWRVKRRGQRGRGEKTK